MTDFGTGVQYRSIRPRGDRRPATKLRKLGRHYVIPSWHDVDSAIVAETSTLSSSVIGYLGFETTKTNGVLMPNLQICEVVTDPTISDVDADAIFIGLLRRVYGGFDLEKRGYLLAKVDGGDERTRRLLEADGWIATSYRKDRSWIPYAWFAFDRFNKPVEGI